MQQRSFQAVTTVHAHNALQQVLGLEYGYVAIDFQPVVHEQVTTTPCRQAPMNFHLTKSTFAWESEQTGFVVSRRDQEALRYIRF
jgi:hypothetical protein